MSDIETASQARIAPVRKGWPKGKPRKPRVSAEESIRPEPRKASATTRPGIRDPAARLAQIRETMPDAKDGIDRLHISPEEIPEGWAYEMKARSITGNEDMQRAHMANLARRGWEPVPQDRHPHFMVEQGGLVLMERPKELTDEEHARNYREARSVVQAKEAQLGLAPPGTLPRDADPRVRPRVNKSIERIEIPDE